jgi:hypothetical protein
MESTLSRRPQPAVAKRLDANDISAFPAASIGSDFSHVSVTTPIRRKPLVSSPGDALEREADEMADKVMKGQAVSRPGPAAIERKCADCAGDEAREFQRKTATARHDDRAASSTELDTTSAILATQRGGAPLAAGLRSFFEPRLGFDFSHVRVHTDADAAAAANSVQARAYTLGSHLVFGRGEFSPGTKSGRHLIAHELAHVAQHQSAQSRIWREPAPKEKPKAPPPPPAGGNILYVGLHNFPLELAALRKLYRGKSVAITEVTLATDEAHTISDGKSFDLTTDTGVDTFAASLGLGKAQTRTAADLIKKALQKSDRDDMAHVMAEYARTQADGKDRMSRVVLSGHSFGVEITNEVFKPNASHIYFSFLVDLAKLFPKAAGQTKHLYVSACYAGVEDNIRDFYQKAFPSLVTFSGWTDSCPTNTGAASALTAWAKTTDPDPTSLAKPPAGRSAWASGFYQGNEKSDPVEIIKNIRSDESRFMDYFNGAKVDPDPHRGWLTNYYGQVRGADLRTASITGADHTYAHQHAEQALRLRFWTDQVAKFWKDNEGKIRAGYGTSPVPNFGKMSRKEALRAIANFPSTAKGGATEKAEAQRLLDGLKNLDEKVLPS